MEMDLAALATLLMMSPSKAIIRLVRLLWRRLPAPNSAGSQFFINLADNTKTFPKNYTIFGHVVQGLDIAQMIQGPSDDPSSKNIAADVMNHVIVVQAP